MRADVWLRFTPNTEIVWIPEEFVNKLCFIKKFEVTLYFPENPTW